MPPANKIVNANMMRAVMYNSGIGPISVSAKVTKTQKIGIIMANCTTVVRIILYRVVRRLMKKIRG